MSIEETVNDFNNILYSLFEQVKDKINNTYLIKYKLLVAVNPTSPINNFKEFIYPNKKKILLRDESFFLNETNYIKNNELSNFESYIKEIKMIYGQLDNDSKDSIWEYFICMTYICKKYCKLNKINDADNSSSSSDEDDNEESDTDSDKDSDKDSGSEKIYKNTKKKQ